HGAPAWPDDAEHLAHPPHRIGEVAQYEGDRRGVEARVVELKVQRVALQELEARVSTPGHLEHLGAEIDPDDAAGRAGDLRQLSGQLAGPASDVNRRAAGSKAGLAGCAPAPAAVGAEREHSVDPVVAAGDAVEHRPDGRRIAFAQRFTLA